MKSGTQLVDWVFCCTRKIQNSGQHTTQFMLHYFVVWFIHSNISTKLKWNLTECGLPITDRTIHSNASHILTLRAQMFECFALLWQLIRLAHRLATVQHMPYGFDTVYAIESTFVIWTIGANGWKTVAIAWLDCIVRQYWIDRTIKLSRFPHKIAERKLAGTHTTDIFIGNQYGRGPYPTHTFIRRIRITRRTSTTYKIYMRLHTAQSCIMDKRECWRTLNAYRASVTPILSEQSFLF